MDFLGMGWLEIFIVAIVALLVLGPEKLPEYARKAGHFIRQFRKITSGLTRELSRAIDLDEEDEAQSAVKKDLDEISRSLAADADELKKSLQDEAAAIKESLQGAAKETSASLNKEAQDISKTVSEGLTRAKEGLDQGLSTARQNLSLDGNTESGGDGAKETPSPAPTPTPQPAVTEES